MGLVVTGLSQNGDVAALHEALAAAGLSTDRLQTIGPDDSTESVSHGIAGADLLTSDGGAGVPGITGGHPRMHEFFHNESLSDRIGDLEIPESELDNYVEAVERGRTVVAYFAHETDAGKVEEIFKTTGLANVRRY
jgi:hypothetical protein